MDKYVLTPIKHQSRNDTMSDLSLDINRERSYRKEKQSLNKRNSIISVKMNSSLKSTELSTLVDLARRRSKPMIDPLKCNSPGKIIPLKAAKKKHFASEGRFGLGSNTLEKFIRTSNGRNIGSAQITEKTPSSRIKGTFFALGEYARPKHNIYSERGNNFSSIQSKMQNFKQSPNIDHAVKKNLLLKGVSVGHFPSLLNKNKTTSLLHSPKRTMIDKKNLNLSLMEIVSKARQRSQLLSKYLLDSISSFLALAKGNRAYISSDDLFTHLWETSNDNYSISLEQQIYELLESQKIDRVDLMLFLELKTHQFYSQKIA